MKRISIIFLLASFLCACTEHYWSEQINIIELGATQKVLVLPDTEPGSDEFSIYANCTWQYEQISGNEWLTVDSVTDDALQFSFYGNNGFKRSARIVVFKDNRRDTLQVRQRGLLTESITVKSFTEVIPAEGGGGESIVETTALEREVMVEAEEPDHFSQLYYSGHRLVFGLKPSTERDKKDYKVTLYFIDGWGERVEAIIAISQAARDDN